MPPRAARGPGGAFGGGLGNSSGNANGQQANTSGASASGAGQNNGTGAGARSGYNGGTDALGPGRKGQDGSAFSANGVTVNADATTNTLIISAPEPMYRSLRKVIDLLDQRRAQVLVESLIVEITENDGAELGIQWLAGGGVFGGANFGKDTFTPGGKNSIQALPKGGLSIGVISGTINIPGVGEVANLGVLRARCRPREAATCCPRRTC
ncbi:secretin N-terminal domain-containing protein [Achromobacter xylosoxidans]